jgi:hypothetical protein
VGCRSGNAPPWRPDLAGRWRPYGQSAPTGATGKSGSRDAFPPDLPMVLLSHHGPVSFGCDGSGRTANRGAGGPVTALIGANVGPPRRRLGMRGCHRRGSAVVGVHDHQVFSATPGVRAAAPRPGRARLSGAPGFHCSAAPGRGRPPGSWPAMSRTERCCGDSCTAWRWDRVAAVIDQQLRARARSSSRKLADLVREVVVQEAQRERVAVLAMDDARGRVAEARAQAAEQALQAGPNRAGPTYRGPGPSPRRPGRTGASRRPERLAGGWRW